MHYPGFPISLFALPMDGLIVVRTSLRPARMLIHYYHLTQSNVLFNEKMASICNCKMISGIDLTEETLQYRKPSAMSSTTPSRCTLQLCVCSRDVNDYHVDDSANSRVCSSESQSELCKSVTIEVNVDNRPPVIPGKSNDYLMLLRKPTLPYATWWEISNARKSIHPSPWNDVMTSSNAPGNGNRCNRDVQLFQSKGKRYGHGK